MQPLQHETEGTILCRRRRRLSASKTHKLMGRKTSQTCPPEEVLVARCTGTLPCGCTQTSIRINALRVRRVPQATFRSVNRCERQPARADKDRGVQRTDTRSHDRRRKARGLAGPITRVCVSRRQSCFARASSPPGTSCLEVPSDESRKRAWRKASCSASSSPTPSLAGLWP